MSMLDEFYILSLKWTREDLLTWWCPNNSGYTSILEQAGRYTRAQVEEQSGYYNDGINTLAIACAVVESHAGRVVQTERLINMIGKEYRREMSASEPCESCGSEVPHPICLGIHLIRN